MVRGAITRARSVISGKPRRPAPAAKPVRDGDRADELNAENRALLRGDDASRRVRPKPEEDASVEDALRDWPED